MAVFQKGQEFASLNIGVFVGVLQHALLLYHVTSYFVDWETLRVRDEL